MPFRIQTATNVLASATAWEQGGSPSISHQPPEADTGFMRCQGEEGRVLVKDHPLPTWETRCFFNLAGADGKPGFVLTGSWPGGNWYMMLLIKKQGCIGALENGFMHLLCKDYQIFTFITKGNSTSIASAGGVGVGWSWGPPRGTSGFSATPTLICVSLLSRKMLIS